MGRSDFPRVAAAGQNRVLNVRYDRPDIRDRYYEPALIQLQDVVDNPDLWENVFTEMMRFDPVVHTQFRRTTREVVLHDEVIPEQGGVVVYLAAGNRDERVFKDPDTFGDTYKVQVRFSVNGSGIPVIGLYEVEGDTLLVELERQFQDNGNPIRVRVKRQRVWCKSQRLSGIS